MPFSDLDKALGESEGVQRQTVMREVWEPPGKRRGAGWIPVVGEEVAQRPAYHRCVFTERAQRQGEEVISGNASAQSLRGAISFL